MLISYRHQFLFIHVPKAAGTSITECLQPLAHDPKDYLVNRLLERGGMRVNLWIGPYRWRRFRKHHTAETVQRHLPDDVYNGLFKFAFVRNPWDWIVSYYHYHLQCPTHHRHDYVRRLGSLAEFIRWRMRRRRPMQVDFVVDRQGQTLVDYIGRFETLYDDFHSICSHLGVQCELPWLKRSRRNDYRNYYDDETAALVAEHCRRDIEAFDYTFDGVEDSRPFPGTLSLPAARESAKVPPAASQRAAA
jgi:hypothetical protein